jgi:hypothetical protein
MVHNSPQNYFYFEFKQLLQVVQLQSKEIKGLINSARVCSVSRLYIVFGHKPSTQKYPRDYPNPRDSPQPPLKQTRHSQWWTNNQL